MIEKRDPDHLSGSGHVSGQQHVFSTRCRIAARMVVDEDEGTCVDAERSAQRVGGANAGPMKAASGDGAGGAEMPAAIEREHPQLFVRECPEPRQRPRGHVLRRAELVRRASVGDLDSPAELERGRDRLCRRQRRVRDGVAAPSSIRRIDSAPLEPCGDLERVSASETL
jgi:hypothetical protein